ncbi:vWA domain-containing protein [Neolewinella persica]|uniref:vWA domain-containing protein n=1 Tax=Neolewinella persica TaxID=70998 RepID=UPI000369E538|nr:vWA domain-containing protein [Neolewinella persica]
MHNLTTLQLQKWADLQEQHLVRGNSILEMPDIDQWFVLMAYDLKEQIAREHKAAFKRGETGYKLKTKAGKGWYGFIMPIDEIDRIGIDVLRREIEVLTRYRENFKWGNYLQRVADGAKGEDLPAVLVGLWQYIWSYTALLAAARRDHAEMRPLFRQLPGTLTFSHRLPSEQCLELLLLLCRRPYGEHWDESVFDRLLAQAHPEVRTFMHQHRMVLEAGLANNMSERSAAAETDFYECCRADISRVGVQEMLDDAAGSGLHQRLPSYLREIYYPGTGKSVADRVRSLAGSLSFMRRLLPSSSTAPAAAPDYALTWHPLAAEDRTNWYELKDVEFMAASKELRPDESRVLHRWEAYLGSILNHLTAPVFRWEATEDGRILPAWNLPSPAITLAAWKQSNQRLELEEEEMEKLEKWLVHLARVPSLSGLKRFLEKAPAFRSPLVARRWRQARQQHRNTLNNRGKYRTQRMREFGLLNSEESEFRKGLWLDEMLKVEEEVRPYMAYVRKAFQAALPIGSTIEFDPYRHRHDGIEFDPETVQDQDKWLRGDVMKTLRSKRNFAPITQVNTFCLDYSRSMTHELMRDLFKVVFLLVMGLEGRRSYDAIHFFGSDFYEVVGFNDGQSFTNRSVLFRVLRNISEVHTHRVIYGGVGGTNISAGVDKSHEKLKTFTEELSRNHPEMNFVSSLFVLTDGQPTIGIYDLEELGAFIEGKRRDGDIAIKGIYLKPPQDTSDFMTRIFGAEHAVEATTFDETVRTFVHVMARTYKAQRKSFRAAEKRQRMLGRRE